MFGRTVVFSALCASILACGPQASEPGGSSSGKADGPSNFIAVVDTDHAGVALLQLTNQTEETAWAEICRDASWERKVEETAVNPLAEGEHSVGQPRVRWEPAGPALLGCDGSESWEHLKAGERTTIAISLPVANWTPAEEETAPAPGTYRLSVVVIDTLGDQAKTLGTFRSSELVLADVSAECATMCNKVKGCQTSAGGTFEATECDNWCKKLLSPTRQATVDGCSACYAQQACTALLPDAEFPYQISTGIGACTMECRLGTCEADSDCGMGESCKYYNEPLAGYFGGGPHGGYGSYGTWADGYACEAK